MQAKVPIQGVITSLEHCLVGRLGDSPLGLVNGMAKRRFDDCPVADSNGKIVGVASVDRLRQLVVDGRKIDRDDITGVDVTPVIPAGQEGSIDVVLLLEPFTRSRCIFVGEPPKDLLQRRPLIFGFMTLSDLNRHAVRSAIYADLAELEMELARILEERYPDPWHWLAGLEEGTQVQLLGYWELTKRRGLDLGPIGATTLSQLMRVVPKDAELLSALELKKKHFQEMMADLIPLRNTVMHPVRPLVLSMEDVGDTVAALRSLKDLNGRIRVLRGRSTTQHL